MKVKITLEKNVKLPKYATSGSAGMDLSACLDAPVVIEHGCVTLVPTGISVAVPSGFAAVVCARSGLSIKHGVCLANGVGIIDSDYRGEIKVGLINTTDTPYTVSPGERIAQLLFIPVATAELETVEALPETERGAGGFGSSGVMA